MKLEYLLNRKLKTIILSHCSRAVVLKWEDFASQGILAMFGDLFSCQQLVGGDNSARAVLLASVSRGQRCF